jgi:3-oxoacyl-[acyl-carrier protein] reductase
VAKYSQIDVLFNNAGAMVLGESLLEINPVRWKQVVDVNVTGTYMVSRTVLPQMIRQMRGIINVGPE